MVGDVNRLSREGSGILVDYADCLFIIVRGKYPHDLKAVSGGAVAVVDAYAVGT